MEKQKKIINKNLESKIRWALLTWALWDALWVPTEMRKQNYLKEKYWRVDDFLPTKDSFLLARQWFEDEWVGYYSDDTVLTFAIVKSLTEIWSIDIQDIWKKHIEWSHSYPYGFWGSTTEAFAKIEEWIPLNEITNPNGGWNGMMMKQFPLAAYFAVNDINDEHENKDILDITKVSHAHPAALVAAIVHHNFLKILLKSDPKDLNKKQIIQDLKCIAIEEEEKFEHREWRKISEVLEQISSYIYTKKNELNMDDKQIMENFWWVGHMKKSGFITTTLWIVYCLFFRNPWLQWVWDAVNFGWDTDTYASIIWNMTWALNWEVYGEENLNRVQNIEELKQQVNAFILKILW